MQAGFIPGRVSYHRFPLYFQPSQGCPTHLDQRFNRRAVSPMNNPGRVVSPLNRPETTFGRGISPLNRPANTPRRLGNIPRRGTYTSPSNPTEVSVGHGVSPLNRPDNSLPGYPPKTPRKKPARSQPVLDTKNSFSRPQNREEWLWFDEEKDDEEGFVLAPLPPSNRRRGRLTNLRTDHRIENRLVADFSRMNLQDYYSRPAAAASATPSGGSGDQWLTGRKDGPLDVTRKEKLMAEISDKKRKLEETRQELSDLIGKKLKELRHEVEEREGRRMEEEMVIQVNTTDNKRHVWRRKQGNSSTQKTSATPRRRLQRLTKNLQDLNNAVQDKRF